MMALTGGILSLSNELLIRILDQLDDNSARFVSIEARAFLSRESLAEPPSERTSTEKDLGSFRCACKRFSELGIPHQFARVTTRFSKLGFERLDWLSDRPHLARHTKKFTYMVPFFFVNDRDRVDALPRDHRLETLDVDHLMRKRRDQREILQTQADLESLGRAMVAFTGLQHVQILRHVDPPTENLFTYIERAPHNVHQLVELGWTPACVHGVQTMGEALLRSKSRFNKFSGPMTSPQSALMLRESPHPTISALAKRLRYLELQFVGNSDLNSHMRELTDLFKIVFTEAVNLRAINILFPPNRPLDLPLQDIFHNVTWRDLRAFGIQSWRLDAEEIIDVARRHRQTLKGIRLRGVLLRDGGRWRDVLEMLHTEMDVLSWVSLKAINYATYWDEYSGGREIPESWDTDSDSEDEENLYSHESEDDTGDGTEAFYEAEGGHVLHADDEDDEDDASDVYATSDAPADEDHGAHTEPWSLHPDTPTSAPWSASSRTSYVPSRGEDLGDNGKSVKPEDTRLWERYAASGARRRLKPGP